MFRQVTSSVHFSAETVGDYLNTSDKSDVTLGSHYLPLLENVPVRGINLNEGFEQFVNLYGNEKLESITSFIEKIAKPGQSLKEVTKSDFVCRRGLLRTLSVSSNLKKHWVLLAVRFNDVIFLCEEKGPQEPQSQNSIRGSYYGYKFEKIMTDPSSDSATPSNGNQAKTVLRGHFEMGGVEHTVLYSGEVDCIDGDGNKMELKLMNGTLDDYWAKNKSLLWYMQSYLANVETIVIGERYRSTLQRTYKIQTKNIPRLAKNIWSPNDCLRCLHSILSELKTELTNNGQAQRIEFANEDFLFTKVDMASLGLLPASFMAKFP